MTTFDLDGLTADNPLAFMAALGTLVVADRAWPGGQVQLAWSERQGSWRPRLKVPGEVSHEEFLEMLHAGYTARQRWLTRRRYGHSTRWWRRPRRN